MDDALLVEQLPEIIEDEKCEGKNLKVSKTTRISVITKLYNLSHKFLPNPKIADGHDHMQFSFILRNPNGDGLTFRNCKIETEQG